MHDTNEQQNDPTPEQVLRELLDLFAPGPDTSIRTIWHREGGSRGADALECLSVPLNDIRPVLERAKRALHPARIVFVHPVEITLPSGKQISSVPHIDSDDGTCSCHCDHCYTHDEHGEGRCICPDCNVTECGAFHLTRG